jgi:hypothetical protein
VNVSVSVWLTLPAESENEPATNVTEYLPTVSGALSV